jgi:hypothetical protein
VPRAIGRWSRRLPTAPRLLKPRHPRLLALAFYAVLGLLTAGWYAIRSPTEVCACIGNYRLSDPATLMWSLAWWPHALLHGLNPFVSHYVWAPTGANLAHSVTIPAAALALAPVTELFGPLASYNVMSVASPVLTAFATYLLCRRITRRELPALAGGYLFGFGPYEFSQLVVHVPIAPFFLVPIMVHLALRRADREISARVYVVALAVVLALQMGLSTEVLATAVMLGVVMLGAARLLAPVSHRGRIGPLLAETAGATALTALVTAPFLYYALVSGGFPHEVPEISDAGALDLLNLVVPTEATWLGSHEFHALSLTFEHGNIAEADGYLSAPIILAFLLWAATTRRRFLTRMLVIAAGVSLLAALGSHLHVEGMSSVALPFSWVRNLPIAELLIPSRIIVYTSLTVAIGVAAWLAEHPARSMRGVARWLVFGVGAVMIFPNIGSGLWGGVPENPTFFSGGAYRAYLTAGDTVLVLPFGAHANDMLWQAETGFYFRMPEGYLGHFAPPQFERQRVVKELDGNVEVSPADMAEFLYDHHVRDVVALWPYPYVDVLVRLGLRPLPLLGVERPHPLRGGILLFHVPSTRLVPPGSGTPKPRLR